MAIPPFFCAYRAGATIPATTYSLCRFSIATIWWRLCPPAIILPAIILLISGASIWIQCSGHSSLTCRASPNHPNTGSLGSTSPSNSWPGGAPRLYWPPKGFLRPCPPKGFPCLCPTKAFLCLLRLFWLPQTLNLGMPVMISPTLTPTIPGLSNRVPQSVPLEHLYVSQFSRPSSNPLSYSLVQPKVFSKTQGHVKYFYSSGPTQIPEPLPINETPIIGMLYFHRVPDADAVFGDQESQTWLFVGDQENDSNLWKDITSDFHSVNITPICHPSDASILRVLAKHHLIRRADFTPNWVQQTMWKAYKKNNENSASTSSSVASSSAAGSILSVP